VVRWFSLAPLNQFKSGARSTLEERFLRDLTHKDILSASFQNAWEGH
jgi:hypothetical protein